MYGVLSALSADSISIFGDFGIVFIAKSLYKVHFSRCFCYCSTFKEQIKAQNRLILPRGLVGKKTRGASPEDAPREHINIYNNGLTYKAYIVKKINYA